MVGICNGNFPGSDFHLSKHSFICALQFPNLPFDHPPIQHLLHLCRNHRLPFNQTTLQCPASLLPTHFLSLQKRQTQLPPNKRTRIIQHPIHIRNMRRHITAPRTYRICTIAVRAYLVCPRREACKLRCCSGPDLDSLLSATSLLFSHLTLGSLTPDLVAPVPTLYG